MIRQVVKYGVLFTAFIFLFGISAYLALTLIIRGEDTVVVPDIYGKDVIYVLKILTDLGLNTKVKGFEYTGDIPQNQIIFQDPKPGAEIKKGRDVKIIISKGPKTVLTPNVKGLSLQQARIILEENGLCQKHASFTYNPSVKKDEIVAQMPASGRMIQRNECVSLLTSMGQRPTSYQMPDMAGSSLDAAIFSIENRRLSLGKIESYYQEDRPRDVVIKQVPHAGYRVTEGSTVNLVLNRAVIHDKPRDFLAEQGVGLFRYRLNSGFIKKRVRVKLSSSGLSDEIFNELMQPGEELWLLIPGDNNSTVFLYEDEELMKIQFFQ
ncbi:MAG: PASTA domain-containing protein [Desulfobacterales bacterium]|nr:PASTA domain-containing protein [Desulfobacterales bacterium]